MHKNKDEPKTTTFCHSQKLIRGDAFGWVPYYNVWTLKLGSRSRSSTRKTTATMKRMGASLTCHLEPLREVRGLGGQRQRYGAVAEWRGTCLSCVPTAHPATAAPRPEGDCVAFQRNGQLLGD